MSDISDVNLDNINLNNLVGEELAREVLSGLATQLPDGYALTLTTALEVGGSMAGEGS